MEIFDATRALTNPYLVCGEIVELGIAVIVLAQAQHGALIVLQQSLVRAVDIGRAQGVIVHATGIHEVQAVFNLPGQVLVAGTSAGIAHELAVPLMQAIKIRSAGRGQRTHEVHCRRRVRVSADHSGRVVATSLIGGLHAIDNVTAVIQQTIGVRIGRTWLGVLASDAAEFNHGNGCAVGQHHGHLQQRFHIATDMRLSIGLKGFRAIAALEQKGVTQGNVCQLLLERLDLGRNHDGRHGLENLAHVIGLGSIPAGLLLCVTLDDVLEDLVDAGGQWRKVWQNALRNIYCPTHTAI